ncbi:MAG TPA: Uma2 family endonuclease [Solirubrobacteraceae bacterium]|nr:Uma2 family endonuclease [Solirubrobacteraceae bacterium]
MRTIVHVPRAEIERRQRLGIDGRDEVWAGVYRMIPPPSFAHQCVGEQLAALLAEPARAAGLRPLIREFGIGSAEDFRVPDGGLLRGEVDGVWQPTAALVLEILSPRDKTWQKLSFYAAHEVQELLIVDPRKRTVRWLSLRDGRYEPIERSGLIQMGTAELAGLIEWP